MVLSSHPARCPNPNPSHGPCTVILQQAWAIYCRSSGAVGHLLSSYKSRGPSTVVLQEPWAIYCRPTGAVGHLLSFFRKL
ncbi:hypothetical protein BgiMline_006055 [Biomphalaria glabrata]